MTLDYHVVALRAPLRKGEDGMFHVVLPDIPDNLTMHVGEAFLDYEFDNGFVTLVFTESQEHVDEVGPDTLVTQDGPSLVLVD